MNDGEASRVFVGDDAEILNTPSWVDVQIKQIKLKDNLSKILSNIVIIILIQHRTFDYPMLCNLSANLGLNIACYKWNNVDIFSRAPEYRVPYRVPREYHFSINYNNL